MEPEEGNLRFYIFTRVKVGDSPMKFHQELESVHGTSCLHDTVCQWIRRHRNAERWQSTLFQNFC